MNRAKTLVPSCPGSVFDLAIIIRVNAFGGSERHTVDMVNYLVDQGWRIVLVQSGDELERQGIDLATHRLRPAPGLLHVVRTALPVRQMTRFDAGRWQALLQHYSARRVLLVKTWYYAADIRLYDVLRKCYPSLFVIEHSMPPKLPEYSRSWHWGVLPGLGLWWHREIRFRRTLAGLVDHTIAVSEAVRRDLSEQVFVPARHVSTCRNGTDLAYWNRNVELGQQFRDELGIPSTGLLFVVAGRLSSEKGVDLAIRAFEAYCRRSLRDTRLCIVGDGPDRAKLVEMRDALGLHDKVVFTGHRRDMVPVYSASDVILMPSITESFGLALGEAMACGCVAVASRVGGTSEVLTDVRFGKLVVSRDVEAWVTAMADFAEIPSERFRQLRCEMRQWMAATHSQHAAMQRLLEVLGQDLKWGDAS